MKKRLAVFLLACASVLCGSCKDSVFSNGDPATDEYRIEQPFHVLEMCDNINVTLRQSDPTHCSGTIYVEAGDNIIDNILAEAHGDTLTISNDNSFNYLRPYLNAVEMTVYADSIFMIIFRSNGTLKTLDTLRGLPETIIDTLHLIDTVIDAVSGDTLIQMHDSVNSKLLTTIRIEILDGSGTANILTRCERLVTTHQYGTACVYGKGYAGYAQTYASYNCHGIIDYRKLESNIHSVTNYGTNRIFVKVFHEIIARNYNNGEIYYLRYRKKTFDHIPGDDEHPWGYNDWVTHYCPQYYWNVRGDRIFPFEENP